MTTIRLISYLNYNGSSSGVIAPDKPMRLSQFFLVKQSATRFRILTYESSPASDAIADNSFPYAQTSLSRRCSNGRSREISHSGYPFIRYAPNATNVNKPLSPLGVKDNV